jgi:hypothetical protein
MVFDSDVLDLRPYTGFGALSTAFLRHTGVRPSVYRG